jgi:hypothetical protein
MMRNSSLKLDFTRDPRDPELVSWLATLDPYEELTVRLALRERHSTLSGDPVFGDRIKALLTLLDPSPQETAAIVRRARELERGPESDAAPGLPGGTNAEPAKPARKLRRP